MSFLHLHIFNKVEGGRIFRQADRGEPEHVVDERRSGLRRKDLVVLLQSLRQELPISHVVMHAVITLKAINDDRSGHFCIFAISFKLEKIQTNTTGRTRLKITSQKRKNIKKKKSASEARLRFYILCFPARVKICECKVHL